MQFASVLGYRYWVVGFTWVWLLENFYKLNSKITHLQFCLYLMSMKPLLILRILECFMNIFLQVYIHGLAYDHIIPRSSLEILGISHECVVCFWTCPVCPALFASCFIAVLFITPMWISKPLGKSLFQFRISHTT